MASLLFPDTANLRVVGTMPTLTTAEMTPALVAELSARIPPGFPMLKDCDVSSFFALATPNSFHHIVLNGKLGIIYEGPSNCEEGDWTVLWPGPEPVTRPDALQIVGDILLIGDGPQPSYVDFVEGCCAGPDDQYVSASLFDPFPRIFTVQKNLALPDGMIGFGGPLMRPQVVLKSAVTLRTAPVVDDTPDPDSPPELPIGNVLNRYAPGTAVLGLAQWTDKAGQLWILVSVPDDPNNGPIAQTIDYLKSFDNANVGWIETAPGVF